jgi:hypothetical protein
VQIVRASLAWWGPIAIVGGALGGIVLAYAMLSLAGGPSRRSALSRRIGWQRTEQTNYPRINLTAYMVALGAVALIVGLSIGLSD